MNGLANTIERTAKTLEERGLPADSFFEVFFTDGSTITEKEVNWSAMAQERRVAYFEGTKAVYVSTLPIAQISVYHGGLEAHIAVPEGCEAYQAVRSETVILDGRKHNRIVGRAVGIVKNGEVIEEQFINDIEHVVLGMRN